MPAPFAAYLLPGILLPGWSAGDVGYIDPTTGLLTRLAYPSGAALGDYVLGTTDAGIPGWVAPASVSTMPPAGPVGSLLASDGTNWIAAKILTDAVTGDVIVDAVTGDVILVPA
jgi:hypothetical protein